MWTKILVACLASKVFATQADESEAVAAELRHHEHEHEHELHHLPIAPGLNQQRKGTLGKLVLGGLGFAAGHYLANKYAQKYRPGYNHGYNPYQQGYNSPYNHYPPQYTPQYQNGYSAQNGYPAQYGYSAQNAYRPQNGYSSTYKPRNAASYPLLSRSSQIQTRGKFGKLVSAGLGLAAGAYLANKITSGRPGYGYSQYRPGGYGYGSRPVYARPPSYYGYSRPKYGYRYRSLPSEEENLEEMANILAMTEYEIMEAQESRHHDMLNQQRGKLSNLLVGGLGLASGLYLANKYRRPSHASYGHGYNNPYGYGYAGYPSRPGYNYNTLGYRQREGADTDIEHLLAQLEDRQAANYGLYKPFYQDLPLYY